MKRQDEAITQIIASVVPHFSQPAPANLCEEPVQKLPTAAYIHIPFCRTRCRYCDFAVTVGTEDLIEKYVQYLLREIAFTPTAAQGLRTVYLGGGTPSLLTGAQLERILTALAHRFGFDPAVEISLEANPGTFTVDKLKTYRSAGINRLSLGVQAFQDHLLALCGRSHGVADIYAAVGLIEAAGFTNFNLDLIFGLPHQTPADWEFSLAEAMRLGPAHLSLYDLILEEQTPFGRRWRSGCAPLPTEDEAADMYLRTLEVLAGQGYEHYEIANFARPGYRCAHNQVYWRNQPYYGIGNGATGYVGGARVERPCPLHGYFAWVEAGVFPDIEPAGDAEQLVDTLLLGLRLLEGVSISMLIQRFGKPTIERILALFSPPIQAGLLCCAGDRLRLSVPQGLLLSNQIFSLLV